MLFQDCDRTDFSFFQASTGSVIRCGIEGEYLYPNPWPQCNSNISCGDPLPIPENDPRLTPTAPPGSRTWIVGSEGDDFYKAEVRLWSKPNQKLVYSTFFKILGWVSLHRRFKVWHNWEWRRGHDPTEHELQVAKILGTLGRPRFGGISSEFAAATLHYHPLHQVGEGESVCNSTFGPLFKMKTNYHPLPQPPRYTWC